MSDQFKPGDLRATYTNHGYPWALVRRNGDTIGKRPSTRMAFLVDTIVGADGKAVALRGYIGTNAMKGWTKSLRRIEFSDVIDEWRRAPSVAAVRGIKRRMQIVKEPA